MTSKQPGEITLELQQERIKKRRIRNIVTNLMSLLHIPDGTHLIDIFGDGHEADNREALTTWVGHLLPDLDEQEVEMRISQLNQRAETRIRVLAER